MAIQKINRRTFLGLAMLTLGMSIFGCSPEAKQTWKDLTTLKDKVQTEYPNDEIQINLWNGESLQIGFLNSDISDLPDSERQTKAQEIARFAYEQYPSQTSPSSVTVIFTIHKRYLGIVSYTNSLDTYRFTTDELTLQED